MPRTPYDITAEDRALAARNQAAITVGYAATLLDRPGPISLTGPEASALMFALYELDDRVAEAAATWQRPDVTTS